MENNNKRPYFSFFRSYLEAIEQCPENVQFELYKAIVLYGLDRKEPKNISPLSKTLWPLIRPILDKQWTKYNNGKNGGAPSGSLIGNTNAVKDKGKTNRKQTENKATPSKEKEKEKEKDNTNIVVNMSASAPFAITIEDRQKAFYNELVPYVAQYTPELVRAFYDYWSEPSQSGSKMRRELEKTWDTGKRLARWERNEKPMNGTPESRMEDASEIIARRLREESERMKTNA